MLRTLPDGFEFAAAADAGERTIDGDDVRFEIGD
jgi:hypothetical protein